MISVEVFNPVHSKIKGSNATPEELKALLDLSEYMRWHVKNYYFMPAYKANVWDGKVDFYSYKTGILMTGLVPLALRYLSTKEGITVDYKDPYNTWSNHKYDIDQKMFEEYGIELYDDQVFAIKELLKYKRGIAELCTGWGKTIGLAAAYKVLSSYRPEIKKFLVIVPDINLINQTSQDLKDLGLSVSCYYGDEKSVDGDIVVATWQSLKNTLQSDGTSKLMQIFQCIFVDECHGAGNVDKSKKGNPDKVIQKLMNAAINAVYRYGLTGTMPKEKATYNSIRGVLGDVLVKVDAHEMQKMGRLTNCKILVNELNYSKGFKKEFNAYVKNDSKVILAKTEKKRKLAIKRAKLSFLAESNCRLDHIAKLSDNGKATLVIVNSIKEGKAIQEKIGGSVFMDKDTPAEERKKHFEDMRNGKLNVIIGTYQLISTGLNIPNLQYIILASPSKSFIRIIQAIGRSLRKHKDKSMAYILDLYDKLSGFDYDARERRQFYNEAKYPIVDVPVNLD